MAALPPSSRSHHRKAAWHWSARSVDVGGTAPRQFGDAIVQEPIDIIDRVSVLLRGLFRNKTRPGRCDVGRHGAGFHRREWAREMSLAAESAGIQTAPSRGLHS